MGEIIVHFVGSQFCENKNTVQCCGSWKPETNKWGGGSPWILH